MKWKQLFVFFTVVLLFLGSVGIPIYKHTCLHEQQTRHTFFIPSDHCAPVNDDCCIKTVTNASLSEHCCEDSVAYFQFHSYSWEQNVLDYQLTALVQQQLHFFCVFDHIKLITVNQRLKFPDPPPITGRERLISQCIWRI